MPAGESGERYSAVKAVGGPEGYSLVWGGDLGLGLRC